MQQTYQLLVEVDIEEGTTLEKEFAAVMKTLSAIKHRFSEFHLSKTETKNTTTEATDFLATLVSTDVSSKSPPDSVEEPPACSSLSAM